MQQDLKSENTKQLIIDAAFSLFYEHGFKSVSVGEIMKKTTMSKGAFYHHYKNKKELGLEVISLKVEKRVVDGMINPLTVEGDAFQLLAQVFTDRLKKFPFYDKQHGCPMNNLINEIGDDETAYQYALKSIIEKWKKVIVELIDRGKKEKSIKDNVSGAAIAVFLISAFEGIRGIRKVYDTDSILDDYIDGLSLYLLQIKN